MSQFLPLRSTEFTARRWRRPTDYRFASTDPVCPLVAPEVPRAALALPVALLEQDGVFSPVMVQSVVSGRNLCVGPQGQWLVGYIPAHYRAYPFRSFHMSDGATGLCMDIESGLLVEDTDDETAELFFTEDGQVGPALAEAMKLLRLLEDGRGLTVAACASLAQHGLLQTWSVTVRTSEGDKQIEGLWRVDEAKLNALEASALKEVQATGGLALAYAQLMSMTNLPTFERLLAWANRTEAGARDTQAAARALPVTRDGDLDLEFLRSGTLSFKGF